MTFRDDVEFPSPELVTPRNWKRLCDLSREDLLLEAGVTSEDYRKRVSKYDRCRKHGKDPLVDPVKRAEKLYHDMYGRINVPGDPMHKQQVKILKVGYYSQLGKNLVVWTNKEGTSFGTPAWVNSQNLDLIEPVDFLENEQLKALDEENMRLKNLLEEKDQKIQDLQNSKYIYCHFISQIRLVQGLLSDFSVQWKLFYIGLFNWDSISASTSLYSAPCLSGHHFCKHFLGPNQDGHLTRGIRIKISI